MSLESEVLHKFNYYSTADQVLAGLDLSNKTFLVTGGTSGLGLATVNALIEKGAEVIFTGRNTAAAERIIKSVKAKLPKAKLQFYQLDLNVFLSVHNFAKEFLRKQKKLDVLILNAGIFGVPYGLTVDGYENLLQVNVLSQLHLLNLLKPLLVKSSPARVVFVSSDSHQGATISLANLSEEVLNSSPTAYDEETQYANTKLCQILLASHLQELWGKDGIAVFSLHPGSKIFTGIGGSSWKWWFVKLFWAPFTKSVQQGAATIVLCAAAEGMQALGGKYWRDCWMCEPSETAKDKLLSAGVWELCQKLIGAKTTDI